MRKGQVAMEFFIYAALFLAVVLAAYFTIFFIQSAEVSNKESLYVRWFGERFASHMNTAMTSQGGFTYTMKFDKSILGEPYEVYIKPAVRSEAGDVQNNSFLFITWSKTNITYSYPLGSESIAKGSSCIILHNGPAGDYYHINTSLGELAFQNNGTDIILMQRC